MKKKIFSGLLALCMCLNLMPVTSFATEADDEQNEVVILYTNDVHTYINQDITYSKVAALKDSYDNALLFDAGDHIQGTAYGSMDKGETIIKLMNMTGYDLATLGNHEFDYGMKGCEQAIEWADYPYVSCNFFHEENGVAGETVLDAYKVFEVNDIKIAVIGVTTPETLTSTTPAYFQDEYGNYIYGIAGGAEGTELYAAVQSAIDEANEEADIIIALGHLGVDESSKPWRSVDVIANTTGLDAFIDGHSHSTVPMKTVADKNGNEVILTQTGEYLGAVGKMTITEAGIKTELLSEDDLADITSDEAVKSVEDEWMRELEEKLGQVIGKAEVTFDNYDSDGNRLVRMQETNTGDFSADALYYLFDSMNMDVDVAIMNGGGIRNQAITGNITYKGCKEIHTFGNVACLQTVTGQQLLDGLEWASKDVGVSENGSFWHTSGMTYKIDTSIVSTVQSDEKGVWTGGPTGEYRVYDVKIYDKESGEWVELDLNATYNLAGYNYTLRDLGGGFAMFEEAVNILDYVMEDYMVLANYIKGFENSTIKATNSPILDKYPNFILDYNTTDGSGRISWETKADNESSDSVTIYFDNTETLWQYIFVYYELADGNRDGMNIVRFSDELANVFECEIPKDAVKVQFWNYIPGTPEESMPGGFLETEWFEVEKDKTYSYVDEMYNLWIGGEAVSKSNTSGDGWSYNPITNTLTLTDYTYSGQGYNNAGIYSEESLNIVLEGTNSIKSTGYYGIYVKSATLTITGDGKLDARGTDYGIYTSQWNVGALTIGGNVTINAMSYDVESGSSYGIRADGALTFKDNAQVTAQSGYAPERSCGIYGYTTLDICDNAIVKTTGGSMLEDGNIMKGSFGIRTTNMTVSGGTLITTGGLAKYDSCGIYTQTYSMTGGDVKAVGGTVKNGSSIGIFASKSVDVNDGLLKASGGDATANDDTSCGIQTGGTITIAGGEVVAETSKGAYTRGIEADKMKISGGKVNAIARDAVITTADVNSAFSTAIQVYNELTATGGNITAIAGDAVNLSAGIQVSGNVDISGGVITANGQKAVKSYGIKIFGDLYIGDANLYATAGDAVSDKTAYSIGLCVNGHVNVDLDSYVEANGAMANGNSAYSSGIETYENNIEIYDGYVTATAGKATGIVKAGSVGIYMVNGGLYSFENKSYIIAKGDTAEVTGNADEAYGYSNGVCVGSGDVSLQAGTAQISAGSVIGVRGDNYGIYVVTGEDDDGNIIGGTLYIEYEDVTLRKPGQGSPGLVGTNVDITGKVLTGKGIVISDNLTVDSPIGSVVKQKTDENGTYFTIVNADGITESENVSVKPLGYKISIFGLSRLYAAIVPAGKSLNESYCENFNIEDFSQMLNIKKDGYTFEGWFTDEEGTKGNEFSFDDIINNDTKIYAKWNPITYTTIIENSNGGLLEVNEDEPIKGQRIVITVKADEGKIVEIITIVDETGNAIELTDNGDGTYSYIQPDSKVTIKATYKDKTSYNEKDENIADKEHDNDIANKDDDGIKEPAETGDNSYYSIWIIMVLFFGVSFITINSRKRA